MKYHGIILDFDGTIVNTEYHADLAWIEYLKQSGYDSDKLPDSIVGAGAKECEAAFKSVYGEDFDYRIASQKVQKIKYEMFENASELVKKGLWELLDYLDELGINKSIGSSSRKEYLEYVCMLTGLKDRFDCIVSGDMVKRGKPAPDIFLKAAEEMNVKPEECIIIEDSENGMLAGLEGGFDSILIIPDTGTTSGDPNKEYEKREKTFPSDNRLVLLHDLDEARQWIIDNNSNN